MKTWQRKDRSLKEDKGKMSKESLTEPSRHSVSARAAASRVSVDSSSAGSSKKNTQNGVSPLPLIHSGKLTRTTLPVASSAAQLESEVPIEQPQNCRGVNMPAVHFYNRNAECEPSLAFTHAWRNSVGGFRVERL